MTTSLAFAGMTFAIVERTNAEWLADLSHRQSDCMLDEVVKSRGDVISQLGNA
jgi:hypothetical protein